MLFNNNDSNNNNDNDNNNNNNDNDNTTELLKDGLTWDYCKLSWKALYKAKHRPEQCVVIPLLPAGSHHSCEGIPQRTALLMLLAALGWEQPSHVVFCICSNLVSKGMAP
jgi:hypothetical protein